MTEADPTLEIGHERSHDDVGHDDMLVRACELLANERDPIANAANIAAIVRESFLRINWVGFYFVRGDELVLGPFAGKPAVTRIAYGAGVCGAAWVQARTLVVPDVHAFPGHIACDLASQSEIVVPLVRDGVVAGVLDCDSPVLARFDDDDRSFFEKLAISYVACSSLA